MRDDAVLGRALPLDRGLGPMMYNDRCSAVYVPIKGLTEKICL